MSTSVKYFHSGMTDAPVLNGVAGSLIGVLDACLVNGFSVRTVNSLSVTSNVATATVSAGHGYEPDTVVEISGATPAGLNGQKRVVATTSTTFTFAAAGISDGSATGTISAKLAAAGWAKPFSGTNLAAYRSPNVEGTREFLYVNDATALNARVVGYESMSDINTGVNAFPTTAQLSGGIWWPNANSTATTARPWVVIGDDRTFYVWVNTGTTNFLGDGFLYGFGDFNSFKSGDAYSCFITGYSTSIAGTTSSNTQTLSYSDLPGNVANTMYVARSFTALGGSLQCSRKAESYATGTNYSGAISSVAYPNGADNSLLLSRMLVTEVSPVTMRGVMPGLLFAPHALGVSTFSTRSKIDGQGIYAGRKLMALQNSGAAAGTTAVQHTSFIDITGPWR